MSSLGEADARVHPPGDPPSAASRSPAAACCSASLFPPACVAGTATLRVAKILENMEIGHNVLHGQWDWMRDPEIHSTTWEWDHVSPAASVEARPQRPAPHVHQHRRQGPRHRLQHAAGRPGPAVAPAYLVQPLYEPRSSRCIFEWGIAVYDLELDDDRRAARSTWAEQDARAQEAMARKAGAGRSRTTSCSRRCRARRSCRPPSARLTANAIRNVWSHAVIFCGHFPDGRRDLRRGAHRGRDRRPSGTSARCSARPTSRARRCCT